MRDEAREARKYASAIMAEKNRGLVMGYYIERSERGKPGDYSHLSEAELDAKIAALDAIEKAQDAARLEHKTDAPG